MKNKIVAIVVTYNRKIMLKECIEALKKSNVNEKFDILIIDNASNDGTKHMIESEFKDDVIYINTGSNLGGAGGFNFGIRQALKRDEYDYCWIMDDDTIVKSNTLEELIIKARELDNNFSFLSSIALWKDGTLCNMNIQKVTGDCIKYYEKISQGLLFVNSASFVSCFINTRIIKQIGLPIKDFFIYGDDVEYTMRLNRKLPGYVVPKSQVIHKMVANDGINIVDIEKDRIDRYYYNFRNLLYIYLNYDKKQYRTYKIKCYYLILKVLFKSKKYKFKRALVIIKALIQHKKFNPKIENIEY